MAAYTSSQAGNWSAQATWGGSGPPGDGDTATINHAVTVDANTTIGTSPAADSGTYAIEFDTGGTLTINGGVTLKVRGDVWQKASANSTTLAAGAVLEIDSSAASSPGSTEYKWYQGGFFNADPPFTCNGTSGSPCIVRSNASGTKARIRGYTNGVGYSLRLDCDWTQFSNIHLTNGLRGNGNGITLADCLFDNAELSATPEADAPISIQRCLWINTPAATSSLSLNTATIPNNGVTRELVNVSTDRLVNVVTAKMTCTDCVFLGGLDWASRSTNAGSKAAGFTRCVFRLPDNNGMPRLGNWTDCHCIADGNTYSSGEYSATAAIENPHWTSPLLTESGTYAVSGTIFESFGSDGNGDIDYSPSSTNTSAFSNCISLPDPLSGASGRLNPGTLTTNNATGGASTYNHCTHYCGTQGGASVAEVGNGATGIIGSMRSNIFWSDAGYAGIEAFNKVIYQTTTPAGAANDMVDPDQCGWNCISNLNSATAQTNAVPYYDTDFSSASNNVGQSDVVEDPDFVDDARNFSEWVESLEATWAAAPSGAFPLNNSPSRTDFLAHGLYMLAVNTARTTHPDANGDYTLGDYLTYVRAGFVPQNESLRDAGHDGVTIGAVEMADLGGARPIFRRSSIRFWTSRR